MAALPVIPERAALVATLLTDLAALAVTAAMVGRLMAAARLVAVAVLEVCSAGAGTSTAAAWSRKRSKAWRSTPRSAAMAALPVIPERAALVATLLADRAALAVTAAKVVTLMAAARLVAVAVREFCSARAETSPTRGCLTSTVIRARPAATAARRMVEMAASDYLGAGEGRAGEGRCWTR